MARRTVSNELLIRTLLKSKFGLDELRPGQEEVIRSVLDHKDTFAIMPTGAGKSLCYQIPALIMPGTTVVVSPLISLMKDQSEKLEKLQITSADINSASSAAELEEDLYRLESGQTEIVHVTPERLQNAEFLEALKKNPIDLFVIDEAHCISQWGHDFRPAYLKLKDAIKTLGRPPVLALTATATDEVIEDIQKQLGIKEFAVVHTGVLRDNLFYEVIQTTDASDREARLLEYLKTHSGPGIVYASTVKAVEELYDALQDRLDKPVFKYHGRMSAKERCAHQESFMQADDGVMIATNAFGMGIDKQDLRFVAHLNFPSSLEAYYQESGRAGRDGQPARCTLFYLKEDKRTQSFFLAGKQPRTAEIRQVYERLKAHVDEDSKVSIHVLDEKIPGVAKKRAQVIARALADHGLLKRAGRSNYKVKTDINPEPQFIAIEESYKKQKEVDHSRLKQMIVYSQSAMCRWKILLSYFDQESEWRNCGHCDSCMRPVVSEEGELIHGA